MRNAYPPEGKELLTVAETAALLGVSMSTMYSMCQNHEIFTVKVRNQWRIPQCRLREQYGMAAQR